MSLITGDIGLNGAMVNVLIGVSRNRRRVLEKLGMSVPDPIPVRAQIDTGTFATAVMPTVFDELQIPPISSILVRTVSTKRDSPHECPEFDVSLYFVTGFTRHEFAGIRALQSDDFNNDEEVQAIIGRDVLSRCILEFHGLESRFSLAF